MPTAQDIFGREKAMIGMVHLGALPGAPHHRESIAKVADRAVNDAQVLVETGFDALLIENTHDLPYLRRDVGPQTVAAMTRIGLAVREAVDVPLGVQVLAGANHAALAISQAIDARFIRAEGFVFASIADEGLLEKADAGPLLRYRRAIGAESIAIFADIKKKHSSHAITADLDVGETARAAEFCLADGVIVTGLATGQPIRIDDLGCARVATHLPLLVGSGVTPDSVADLFAYADALIVGSWYKEEGDWANTPSRDRAKQLINAADACR